MEDYSLLKLTGVYYIPWYLKVLELSGRRVTSFVLTVLANRGLEFCGYCNRVVTVGHPDYVCRSCWDSDCDGSITKIPKEVK